MKKSLLFLTFCLIAFTSVLLWFTKDSSLPVPPRDMPATEIPIGGGFTLTDQNGKSVSDTEFRGQVMLVFFGFTHCPDICPVTMAIMTKTLEQLGAEASQVAPVFITVDPARDTPPVLKEYLANFHPRIVGLTGSPEDITKVAAAYKAYYAKAEPPAEEAHGHGGGQDHHAGADYNVNHSGYVYMMSREGKYLRHFPYDVNDQELAAAIREYLKG